MTPFCRRPPCGRVSRVLLTQVSCGPPALRSRLEECQQVSVDPLLMCGRYAVRRSLVISDPPRHDRSSCLSEFSPGLAIEEHHILLDGLAANVQLIGGEVWVGVADRQAAQNRQFRRDSQLCADDLGIPRD